MADQAFRTRPLGGQAVNGPRKICSSCGLDGGAQAEFCQDCGTPLLSVTSAVVVAVAGAPPSEVPETSPGASTEGADPADAWVGQLLLDQFRIEELVGQGGMGTVYRA